MTFTFRIVILLKIETWDDFWSIRLTPKKKKKKFEFLIFKRYEIHLLPFMLKKGGKFAL